MALVYRLAQSATRKPIQRASLAQLLSRRPQITTTNIQTRLFHSSPFVAAKKEDGNKDKAPKAQTKVDAAAQDEVQGEDNKQKKAKDPKEVKLAEKQEIHNIRNEMLKEMTEKQKPYPILSEKMRQKLYDLHVNDPEKWNITALALEYKINPDRVVGILRLMQRRRNKEEYWFKKEGIALDTTAYTIFQASFVRNITDHLRENVSNLAARQKASQVSQWALLEPEVDEMKYNSVIKQSGTKKKSSNIPESLKRTELPAEAPKKYDTKPVVLRPAVLSPEEAEKQRTKRGLKVGEGNVYVINSDRGRNDFNREIYVMEIDGLIRTASWDERRELLKNPKKVVDPLALVAQELGPYYKNNPENQQRIKEQEEALEQVKMIRKTNQIGKLPTEPFPIMKVEDYKNLLRLKKDEPAPTPAETETQQPPSQ